MIVSLFFRLILVFLISFFTFDIEGPAFGTSKSDLFIQCGFWQQVEICGLQNISPLKTKWKILFKKKIVLINVFVVIFFIYSQKYSLWLKLSFDELSYYDFISKRIPLTMLNKYWSHQYRHHQTSFPDILIKWNLY